MKNKIKHTYPPAVGPVTEVKTDIFVTSFGPVSDVEMVCEPHWLLQHSLRIHGQIHSLSLTCNCLITGKRSDVEQRKYTVFTVTQGM